RLRDLPYMKIFSIAFVWSASTILLPMAKYPEYVAFGHWAGIFVERFVFVFAITIPFDIRDMEEDRKSGIKTIPLLLGVKHSLLVANACLLGYMVMGIFHYQGTPLEFMVWVSVWSGCLTLIVINHPRLLSLANYHYGILDGTMVLQGTMAFIGYLYSY
ncbi:MAG: UbiA family prenyltransferase, partial [Cytophagales bacterium]|nr:UbiA family prenyltransferase [Cytophagales bacterium]